jgi:predicted RNA-binding Zn-ribbon protein involved in translation (DUF1610 family)
MGTSGPTRGPGKTAAKGKSLSPAQGAQQAEQRVGKPCYHVGQKVPGIFACVACQFRINNRGVLPSCPDCGEIIWAYMGDGPRPIPEGETAAPPAAEAPTGPAVEDNVSLEPTAQEPVKVEEGVKLEP